MGCASSKGARKQQQMQHGMPPKPKPQLSSLEKTEAIAESAEQKQAAASSAAQAWRTLIDTDNDGSINVDELNRLFETSDKDGDGKLTADELRSIIEKRLGEKDSMVLAKQLIDACDEDHDGSISRKELFDFFANEEEVKKAIANAEKVEAEMEYG